MSNSTSLLKPRLVAGMIDYAIIVMYIIAIAIISNIYHSITQQTPQPLPPLQGELMGLFLLIIPVFCYFFFTESSSRKASIGKRLRGLQVISKTGKKGIFWRNVLKVLPWEIAHSGVHWLFYYDTQSKITPFFVYILLILPMVIVIFYAVSIILSKGHSSVYDQLTKVHLEARI
ncbi:RDD family protein [Chitinophaga skermanii]|uniref:RDD family protein n=1 Tax=Chitinophaga skermanii TaxID=331697 RepID=A0A327QLH4_9BACT|nr:RDD family protein [Chitinophaga skermanii]RAJ05399.1 RDD family protein [Chitinophaga skermanii]